jgi:hypothetical protein
MLANKGNWDQVTDEQLRRRLQSNPSYSRTMKQNLPEDDAAIAAIEAVVLG